jgi:hypothetical protein
LMAQSLFLVCDFYNIWIWPFLFFFLAFWQVLLLLEPLCQPQIWLFKIVFFSGSGDWGLNSGFHSCEVSCLPLKPCLQSILLCLFWRWILMNIFPGWPQITIFLNSTSQVDRSTGVSHWWPAENSLGLVKLWHYLLLWYGFFSYLTNSLWPHVPQELFPGPRDCA